MKYIKPFNEQQIKTGEVSIEALKEFCDKYLSYIIDRGFRVRALEPSVKTGDSESIFIDKENRSFKFDDIKDDIIPFSIILKKEYDIYPNIWVKYTNSEIRMYNIDEMSEVDNKDLSLRNIEYLRFIFKKNFVI